MTNLKNYTSSVPINLTLSYIEAYLMECGVSGITKQVEKGTCAALFFHLEINGDRFTIRLPAQVDKVQDYFWREYVSRAKRPNKTKEDFREQAERTAWKIQQDWVQVQMSLIKLKQVHFLEVFMGFLWDGKQSYYQRLEGGGFRGIRKQLAEKNDAQVTTVI